MSGVQTTTPGLRRVLLVGGDEFRPTCTEMDRALLSLTDRQPPAVAIIPTAAAFENPRLAASNGVRHFTGLGALAHGVDLVDRSGANDSALVSQVADADVIYFTGGSPDHLRSVLADSPFLEAVVAAANRGATLAGSSAGAMVMGQLMRRPAAAGSASPGLALVPGVMTLPHHERSDPAAVSEQVANSDARPLTVLGIDGATGVLLEASGARALGSGRVTVYSGGGWVRYDGGDAIPGLTVNGPTN